ncbi:MAG: hypothetical protein ACKO5W_06230, partial [Crocinitomicaceae bacterium]
MQRTNVTLTKALLLIVFGSVFLFQKSIAFTSNVPYSRSNENPLMKWERYIQSDLDSCKILVLNLRQMDNKSPNDDAIFHMISGSYLARIG